MEDKKLHYDFEKGVSVENTTKNIQGVYLDRASALQMVKNGLAGFLRMILA